MIRLGQVFRFLITFHKFKITKVLITAKLRTRFYDEKDIQAERKGLKNKEK